MRTFVVLTCVAMLGFIFPANASNGPRHHVAPDNFPSNTAMAAIAPAHDAASLPVAFMEAATEETMEVENWMTNEILFAPLAVSEPEAPMEVEEWMTNAENFRETTFTVESDQVLEVESWMVDKENFSSFTITEETEQALEVQDWMLNEESWGI